MQTQNETEASTVNSNIICKGMKVCYDKLEQKWLKFLSDVIAKKYETWRWENMNN